LFSRRHPPEIAGLESGDQPLRSDDGDTVIVFNGEIYNSFDIG